MFQRRGTDPDEEVVAMAMLGFFFSTFLLVCTVRWSVRNK
jgi:hypothetical protein